MVWRADAMPNHSHLLFLGATCALGTVCAHAEINFLGGASLPNGGEIVARILDWARDRVEYAAFPSRAAADDFIAHIAPGTQHTVIDEQAPPGALEIALF